jgi:hypothetical protein
MFIAEACLLQAIRDKLVDDLGLEDGQCQVELDGQLPATAPKLYVAVSPGGVTAGPRHRSSGGAIDLIINAKVTVYNRVAEIARDRRRSTFIKLLTGLAPTLELVTRALDNNYQVLDSAVAIITDTITELGVDTPGQITENETGKFPEPFRQFSPELSARMVFKDPYDAAQMAGPPADPIIAIARSITFSGARYMQVRSTWAP